LTMNTEFEHELNRHIYLVYTGTTRLAKNLLKQVLYRWSKHTPEIIETIHGLVNGAVKCRNAIEMNDLDEIGQCVSEYWTYKKVMAGPDSGVEPSIVTNVIEILQEKGLIRGASLCGAGGGGFMVLMTHSGISLSDMQSTIEVDPHVDQEAVDAFTWHTCQVCMEGLTVKVVLDDDEIPFTVDYFSIDWLL
jgi:fucokinase